jgi:hypothetical protein
MRNVWGRLALVTLLATGACAGTAAAAGDAQIKVLSNRADLVSGDDALVQVVPPSGTPSSALRVDVDGRDVTSAFAVRQDGRVLGLLTGLKPGANVVTVRAPGGRGARLRIVDHPIGGPTLAGPQIQPWACAAGALDAQCNPPLY